MFDLAQVEIESRIPVQLTIGDSDNLQIGDPITLLGFPRHHLGDSVQVAPGPIIQSRMYFGVPHFIIQPAIIQGNSGGPVLDKTNRVVGVAVKGLNTPGRFSREDELSSFVPINMVKHLAARPAASGC